MFLFTASPALAPSYSYASYIPQNALQTTTENEELTAKTSCIVYLQGLGVNISGDASEQVPNISEEETHTSDIIIFHYENTAHVAQIIGRTPNGWLVRESNYEAGVIGTRHVGKKSPHIYGYMRVSAETLQSSAQ